MTEKQLIIIREKWWQSLLRDAGTFVTFIALIGIGWLIESYAMQWIGAVLGLFSIFGRTIALTGKHTYSLDEARKLLADMEP